jgi:hypothetical protein
MASWRSTFSYIRREPNRSRLTGPTLPALALALLVSGCGHADEGGAPAAGPESVAATGAAAPHGATAGETTNTPGSPAGNGEDHAATQMPSAEHALCVPADEGRLRARLTGGIDAEIDWAPPTPQCLGGLRPDGEGVRLVFKGDLPGQGPLLVVIGIGPLRAGANARNVPANLTLVREGTGVFYATQGDDKCAMDDVKQEPLDDDGQRFRLTGRGYCTQPARAVGGDGSVMVPRFDVSAVVNFK